jgi:hypothetical protein
MTPEQKLQVKGLTAVGIILMAAGVVIAIFLETMSSNALMGESPKYKPEFPAIPVTDISHAPQCNPGYEKQWIGCQRLDQ